MIYTVACKEGKFVAAIRSISRTGTGGQGRFKGGTPTVARNQNYFAEFVSQNYSDYIEVGKAYMALD
jgi:hypothetical protein